MKPIPDYRIRRLHDGHNEGPRYILYWMTAARRTRFNFALQRAVALSITHKLPLLVFEPLRVGYQHASARFHRFVMDGMAVNAKACAAANVTYFPYVERLPGEGQGLLQALSAHAAVVIADDSPAFFLPRMVHAAARELAARKLAAQNLAIPLEAVDSNGLYPLYATDRAFTVAHSFRRHLQKQLPPFLAHFPEPEPLQSAALRALPKAKIPTTIRRRWPLADLRQLNVGTLPIDQRVAPTLVGGVDAAETRLQTFLSERLDHYADGRNSPDGDPSSGLSPYLHFGHIGSHAIVHQILKRRGWSKSDLGEVTGKRTGWWGLDAGSEAFLEQLVTWRELAFNGAAHLPNYTRYDALPEWARRTLDDHRRDKRANLYDLDILESARTHDEIWNAAQRQLVQTGVMHNYLRMLWGKLILQWSPSPEEAAERMVYLNDKYAIDGRDPNSYAGIYWVLGRYDRAWGPERPIFGKVRYMTSDSTRRKLKLAGYLTRFGAGQQNFEYAAPDRDGPET